MYYTPLNQLTNVGCFVLVEHTHNNHVVAMIPALTLRTVEIENLPPHTRHITILHLTS